MIRRLLASVAVGSLVTVASAQDGEPLSAIDWLSSSVEPATLPPIAAGAPPIIDEPASAGSASTPGVTVTPLDSTAPDATGVLDPDQTGLPATLWAGSTEETLVTLIRAEAVETLPALRDLLVTLMLARAEPPMGSAPGGRLFITRVDKLLDIGALGPAQALLESGDLLDPETFRRWFDVTLLTGTENAACTLLREHPSLAPTLMARVFCLARNGDWTAAALTLNTARALGDVAPEDDALLSLYLEAEDADATAVSLPPVRPSPLAFRIREAVGETVPTAGLPLAFSHADLRSTIAWRAQIEAAERLARNGALPEDVLLDIYRARKPAASGGVWDRAQAIQRLEDALGSADEDEALAAAWRLMEEARLQVPFAGLYGERLQVPEGPEGTLAFRVAMLSPGFEAAVAARVPATPREALWRDLALGGRGPDEQADGAASAVLAGLTDASPPDALAELIAEDRTGEAALRAIATFEQGLDGDRGAITDALATFVALGLDDVARQAALQYLILGESP